MAIQMSERMLRYGCARPSLNGPGTNVLRFTMRSRIGTKSAVQLQCVSQGLCIPMATTVPLVDQHDMRTVGYADCYPNTYHPLGSVMQSELLVAIVIYLHNSLWKGDKTDKTVTQTPNKQTCNLVFYGTSWASIPLASSGESLKWMCLQRAASLLSSKQGAQLM